MSPAALDRLYTFSELGPKGSVVSRATALLARCDLSDVEHPLTPLCVRRLTDADLAGCYRAAVVLHNYERRHRATMLYLFGVGSARLEDARAASRRTRQAARLRDVLQVEAGERCARYRIGLLALRGTAP